MFDFKKLNVYSKSREFCSEIYRFIKEKKLDRVTSDQLRRASFSIMLNIAEGSSRFGNKDRKHFMVIARGSVFECVSILEFLVENELLDLKQHDAWLKDLEEISKMLFGLIRKLDNTELKSVRV